MTGMVLRLRNLARLETTSDDLLHVDLMRFIAAIGVVLCHSGEFLVAAPLRAAVNGRLAGLALFVDVFFVISGFVIAHVYSDRIAGWRNFIRFMQRRVGRLLPLHLLTLAAMAMIFYLVERLGLPTNTDMTLTPECVAVGALLLHALIDCGGPVPNGVNWSISAEMVMYVLFPVLLTVFARLGRLRYLALAALLSIVALRLVPGSGWANDTQFWRALPAFSLGLILRIDWTGFARWRVPGAIPIMLAAALFAGSLALFPTWLLVVLAYATAATAIAADSAGRPAPLTRRFAPLGQLTYSIYMLHPIIVLTLVNALGDKMLKLQGAAMFALILTSYGAIYLASLLSYRWFETPARHFIDGLRLIPAPDQGGAQPHV